MKIDIVYTYYNGINLLEKYIDHWNNNFNDVKHKINFILIDDHSDESCKAINIVQKMDINFNFQLYHVDDNILWNEMGARNLGGSISTSDTLLFLDWDHLITQELIHEIFTWPFDEKNIKTICHCGNQVSSITGCRKINLYLHLVLKTPRYDQVFV